VPLSVRRQRGPSRRRISLPNVRQECTFGKISQWINIRLRFVSRVRNCRHAVDEDLVAFLGTEGVIWSSVSCSLPGTAGSFESRYPVCSYSRCDRRRQRGYSVNRLPDAIYFCPPTSTSHLFTRIHSTSSLLGAAYSVGCPEDRPGGPRSLTGAGVGNSMGLSLARNCHSSRIVILSDDTSHSYLSPPGGDLVLRIQLIWLSHTGATVRSIHSDPD
jgi:hypothetical protein